MKLAPLFATAAFLPLLVRSNDGHHCPLEKQESTATIDDQKITVTYKWVAQEGKLQEVRTLYEDVIADMQANEPEAQEAHCFISDNAVHVRDEFSNSAGLGFHLNVTAASHFGQLQAVASPGSFLFHGSVPDELKQGVAMMGLQAEFAPLAFGFERPYPCCPTADERRGRFLTDDTCPYEKDTAADNSTIIVTYKWTAQDGKLNELRTMYEEVLKEMEEKEPDALAAYCYIAEEDNALHVRDDFKDAAALSLHLSTTAPSHFGQLLEIATPGTFLFHGTVPDELKEGVAMMGLTAEFAPYGFGFERPYGCCPVETEGNDASGAEENDASGADTSGAGTVSALVLPTATVVVAAVVQLLLS